MGFYSVCYPVGSYSGSASLMVKANKMIDVVILRMSVSFLADKWASGIGPFLAGDLMRNELLSVLFRAGFQPVALPLATAIACWRVTAPA